MLRTSATSASVKKRSVAMAFVSLHLRSDACGRVEYDESDGCADARCPQGACLARGLYTSPDLGDPSRWGTKYALRVLGRFSVLRDAWPVLAGPVASRGVTTFGEVLR